NPKKWIKGEVANSQYSILDYEGHMFQFDLPVPTKSVSTTNYKDYFPTGFFLNTEQDSLFIQTDYNAGTLKFPAKGNDWPQFQNHETYAAYTDSVAINWDIIAQHPSLDSLYFARAENQNGLYRSEQSLQNFTQVDTNSFSSSLKFDSDSSHIYSLGKNGIFKSSELGAHSTWSLIEIGFETNSPKFLTIDDQIPGRLFISDSTLILNSDDFGNSFTELIFVDDQITGLYKKPDSDLLYVLTTEELLEVNTETQETTTLKQLPVSSEPEPKEIPNQITLEQNYPNPFNPTTVISYQLAVNSLVNLEVFDVMGRKVAVLVDGERKSAGSHQVTFDASGLSSGMYFYRLQSAGQTFTQKMMLVK
ncbi:MAG: T9SS type A sorting domain-containing protein, partial [Balneolaceae bacterium]